MAKNETKRIKPSILADDLKSYAALQGITDYAPANPAFSIAGIAAVRTKLEKAREKEAQARAALDAARDEAVAAEWEFHNAMLGVDYQVAAQYGKNSNEWQALGNKKPSEYKPKTLKKK